MPSARVTAWLVPLADPTGPAARLPRARLRSDDLPALWDFADDHSVLPTVRANLKRVAEQSGPGRALLATDQAAQRQLDAALASAQVRLLARTGLSLKIRGQLARIAAALNRRRLPAMVMKGSSFADRLYPDPALRPFTDLDLLVPDEAVAGVEAALAKLGYRSRSQPTKYVEGYGQRSWRLSDNAGLSGTVEVHWNLVNSPTLRAGLSVPYHDLQLIPPAAGESCLPTASPAALLLIAAVHAGASHNFDRVGLICDICQAVRGAAGPIDTDWLTEAAERTGTRRVLGMGLRLCNTVLGEPAGEALARRLHLPAPGLFARALQTRAVVLGCRTPLVRARRLLFRQALKKS